MDARAVEILMRGYRREGYSKEDCRYLLSFQEFSPEAIFTRDLFERYYKERCDWTASIGAQIGVYTGPCSGDCGFCNFGASHTTSKPYEMPDDVFVSYLRDTVRFGDANDISIMTNQDCPLDTLVHFVRLAKQTVPKDVKVLINTGDRAIEECRELRKAGAEIAYHVCRMGEGRDTAFDPKVRIQTITNLIEAGFLTMTCTEPIGQEHSIDEVIDDFFRGRELGCVCGSVAMRMPVFGTPLGSLPTLSIKRYNQIKAVLALATSDHHTDPRFSDWDVGYLAGLNSLSAELAGSPRDTGPLSEKSVGHTMAWCRRTLFGDGFDKIRKADGSVVRLDAQYLLDTESL